MRHPRTFLLSMLGLCCGLVPAAQAATWIWPDLNLILPGPCAGTLQACVNNAANGDTILIGRVALEGERRGDLLDPMALPEPVGAAKRRDAALRRDAGARQGRDAGGPAQHGGRPFQAAVQLVMIDRWVHVASRRSG